MLDEPVRIIAEVLVTERGVLRSDIVNEPGWRVRRIDAAAAVAQLQGFLSKINSQIAGRRGDACSVSRQPCSREQRHSIKMRMFQVRSSSYAARFGYATSCLVAVASEPPEPASSIHMHRKGTTVSEGSLS